MSPTHSNKLGVRYRYYVSHALLQNRKAEAGSVARVPAPEIEALVLDGVRKQLASFDEAERAVAIDDRDLIERCIDRIVAKPKAIEVRLLLCDADRVSPDGTDQCREDGDRIDHSLPMSTTTITLAWTAASFAAVKGIIYTPAAKPAMKHRDALLAAIVKARAWIEGIRLGRIASFAEIAKRESQGERYIRLLAPLAFVSPRIVAAIVDGTAPADLTVTGLAKALPYSWAEQERTSGSLR
jgi:site-specific DNA recombinase